MSWLHFNKTTISATLMQLIKHSGCKLRLQIRHGRPTGVKNNRPWLGSETTVRGRKKWMSPRSEMVGWRERSCCALSGGRRRVRWRRGGRTISAGTGAQDRRRSAGYRSTLPFFLHNDTEARAERQVSQQNSRSVS